MIHAGRPAGEHGVEQLTSTVCEPGGVPAGCPVPQRQLDLGDAQPCFDGVDRHPHLAAEARREREASVSRRLRECALAGERLLGRETG